MDKAYCEKHFRFVKNGMRYIPSDDELLEKCATYINIIDRVREEIDKRSNPDWFLEYWQISDRLCEGAGEILCWTDFLKTKYAEVYRHLSNQSYTLKRELCYSIPTVVFPDGVEVFAAL